MFYSLLVASKQVFVLPKIQSLHKCVIVWLEIIVLRRHQKQRHETVTFKGIRVSVQYKVSVLISNDIWWLALDFIAHFSHSIISIIIVKNLKQALLRKLTGCSNRASMSAECVYQPK